LNNKKLPRKTASAVFLAIVLVLGTIALSSSFMKDIQAQQEYGAYNNYENHYGKDNNKSKDSNSANIKKLKCNNINANLNNVDASFGSTVEDGDTTGANGVAGGEALAAQGGESITANGDRNFVDIDNDFAFVCINNNNNIVTGNGGNATDGDDDNVTDGDGPDTVRTTLSVTKNIGDCTPIDNSQNAIDACTAIGTQILPNLYTLSVIDNTLNPTFVEGSEVPVVVTVNPGDYQVVEIATPSLLTAFEDITNTFTVDILPSVTFTGDCTPIIGGGGGTIAEGELQTCNIVNSFDVRETIE